MLPLPALVSRRWAHPRVDFLEWNWQGERPVSGIFVARIVDLRHQLICGPAMLLAATDPRTLGMFRLVLASVVIYDLHNMWADVCDFYSDEGLIVSDTIELNFNLHSQFDGSCQWTSFLFGSHLGLAVLLFLGVFPQLCCFCIWVLYLSLQARNSFIQCGGDTLLRFALFLGAFTKFDVKPSIMSLLRGPATQDSGASIDCSHSPSVSAAKQSEPSSSAVNSVASGSESTLNKWYAIAYARDPGLVALRLQVRNSFQTTSNALQSDVWCDV